MVKIGDKVRFLKEVGGGRVSGFRDKFTVLVEDADGFEIPMPVTDVVVEAGESYEGGTWEAAKANAGDRKAAAAASEAGYGRAPKVEPRVVAADSMRDDSPKFHAAPYERREGEKLNVYLAFLPTTPDDMVDTAFEAYLVNDSNYFITLTWLSVQGNAWRARFGGTIEPNTKEFMEEISRAQIDDISRVAVQLIAYKRQKPFELKPAVSVEMRIDGTKFYKAGAFKQSMFFEEPALVLDVVRDDAPVRTVFADAGQIRDALMEKKPDATPQRPRVQPARTEKGDELVVNLHDYALLDNKTGLSNADILKRQLLEVRDVMEKYKKQKGKRIVFIHGKGEGVLRAEVLRELKRLWPTCRTQDASFQEYGFGATLVTIQ